jgi:hypothetical protein
MWEILCDNTCNVKHSHNCWFGREQSDMTNVMAAILSLPFMHSHCTLITKEDAVELQRQLTEAEKNIEYLITG